MINQLIKMLYDPDCSLTVDEEFYRQAIEEIEASAVSSQIYHLLKEQGRLEETPLFFRDRLKNNYNEALHLNLFIKNQSDRILQRFETDRIKVIPLKGVYFAEKYFGHIGARGTSDIDLLVRKEDVERAVYCVKALGFHIEQEQIPSHFHLCFSKRIPGAIIPLTVEIHWNIVKETTSNFKIEPFWNNAVPYKQYGYVMALSDYHTFYMICMHGWRHNLESAKYFIDIIQLIYILKDSLNYDLLYQDASAHKTRKRLVRTLSIVYESYPMLDNMKEIPIKRKRMFQNKNNRLHLKKITKYLDFMDYQFLSYDNLQHSLREVSNWILPGKTEILAQINIAGKEHSYLMSYLYLCKTRFIKALKAFHHL
ncbi:nucleotidyltransferase family protein [Paenibacillus sp. LHD-38]|uniref:nucleotidyltransferase domain-containing protein n=1 Tax=Paenibacillus sp. LHD-38 TaxID=3072143 RepID=UPI00280D2539|nr:nucleotidyltransferase family protein [Paenibacillus sp. LHD-38]MDQ8737927.1 nucleotidyltransferase family protein [Paenibacillus sp. LHD-38]